MNQYEIAVLYDPDLEIDLEKAETKVKKILTDGGGEVVGVDNWGKRKLAYPIKKSEHAVYVFYTVKLPSEAIQKIEGILNITDEVIRFLITRPDLKAMAKAEAQKAAKAAKAEKNGEDQNNDKADEGKEPVAA